MCTVTYLPIHAKGEKGSSNDFILTSNRDEKTSRAAALPPSIHSLHGHDLIFPQDPKGKGSWIAASGSGTVVCLLNGAFFPHEVQPTYKHSRGLVVTDYFKYHDIEDFQANYDFSEIEPFTLVIVENGGLSEIRWNGEETFRLDMDPQEPQIWSSVTLYTPETIAKRQYWFEEWLEHKDMVPTEIGDKIIGFHKFGGEGQAENDILMNRNDFLRTVSISSIQKSGERIHFLYSDLMNKKEYEVDLTLATVHE